MIFDSIEERFQDAYERRYGFRRDGVPIIVRACRVRVRGRTRKAGQRMPSRRLSSTAVAQKGTRPVYFVESEGFAETPVYDRTALSVEGAIRGPAVLEEVESTTVVPPGWRARVDEFRNIIMTSA